MKKISAFRILTGLIVAVLALSAATPVSADGPVYYDFEIDFVNPVPNPCGFEILEHMTGTLKNQHWYPSDHASPVKLFVTFVNGKSTWSANGKSLNLLVAGPQHMYTIEPAVKYLDILLGTNYFTIVPGTGHVLGSAGQMQYVADWDTGYIIEFIKVVGNLPAEDWQSICAYLAP